MNDYWLDYIALSAAQKLVEASDKIYVGRNVQKTAVFQCIVRQALEHARIAPDVTETFHQPTETNEQRNG